MSETTTTPNYNLIKPNVNADSDLWGDHWNQNADTLDSTIKTIENKAGVTTWNTRSGAVSLSQADVTTVLPPGAGTPAMDGTATAGTLLTWSKSDHVHPTDTTRYAASNPAGYVTAAQAGTAAPVQSVATRTGAVVLTHTDITDWNATLAPYAPLASPPLSGSPTAPTVSPSTDNSTKLATTAFVQSALGAVPGGAIVSATPPTANPGALWYDSTGGQTYVRYDDGNSVQWVPSANITGLANAAQLSDVAPAYNNVGRNLIHNPLMAVAQRGAGPWSTTSYTLDRWFAAITTDASNIGQGALADSDRAAIGDEAAQFILSCSFVGNAAAGASTRIAHNIENVRRLAGKTITASFYAIASVGGLKLGSDIIQYFGSGGSPSASVYGNGQSVALTTTWARYSLTFAIPSIAGKTVGTNSDHYTSLSLWFSSGATNNVLAGNIGVQSGTINLWGVQLEIGSVATPLEKPDPQQDLAKCQRFYQTYTHILLSGYNAAGGIVYNALTIPQMRATPAVIFANFAYTNTSALSSSILGTNFVVPQITITATGYGFAYTDINLSADL